MAKYTGPACRQCRREGVKLFSKGERCYTEKCALNRRSTAPGQHGAARKKIGEYGPLRPQPRPQQEQQQSTDSRPLKFLSRVPVREENPRSALSRPQVFRLP